MKRKLFFIGLTCFALGGECLLLVHLHTQRVSYRTNAVNGINFEIVTTQAAQQQGLGGRATIPGSYAMLFVFPTDSKYGFWMKDMLTSIDMIWVSSDGTIVGITPAVSPSTYPNVFYPPHPIRYVLETRVGFAKEKNWQLGTKIQLPLPSSK